MGISKEIRRLNFPKAEQFPLDPAGAQLHAYW